MPDPSVKYFRKVIRIKAEDSPNVRLALMQRAAGLTPDNRVIIPGVLTWEEYLHRRATWDKIRQCVGLDAEFYIGTEILLFPPLWLNFAERDDFVRHCRNQPTEAIGIDPAEGGDKTAMSAINRYGVKEIVARKTPDTYDIVREAKAFILKHHVPYNRVGIDRGGGGKQIADTLNAELDSPYKVRTIAFGESLVLEPKRGLRLIREKVEQREEHYTYVDRRTQMYWELSMRLDPSMNDTPFALPSEYPELRQQLALIPRLYDKEGRCRMLHKNRNNAKQRPTAVSEPTLVELIGHSPDEADCVMVGYHVMIHDSRPTLAQMF